MKLLNYCYICQSKDIIDCTNNDLLKTKYSETNVVTFFQQIAKYNLLIEHGLDDVSMCFKCLDIVNECDLAISTANKLEDRLNQMILKGKETINDNNMFYEVEYLEEPFNYGDGIFDIKS